MLAQVAPVESECRCERERKCDVDPGAPRLSVAAGRPRHHRASSPFRAKPRICRTPEWGVDRIHDLPWCCDSGRVFESLIDVVTASSWVYPLILGVAALDAVFPLVPSEATVIAAAALAGAGDLVLSLILVSAAGGAVIGDNVAYLLGRVGQRPVVARLLRSHRLREPVTRAETMLRERSATIIVVSRFIPGGRTATMLSAGLVGLRWGRFAPYDLGAAILWAGYASLVGLVGGKAFADKPLHALLLAFGLAAVLALLIEGARRLLGRTSRL